MVWRRHPWEPHLPILSLSLSITESRSPPAFFAFILKGRIKHKTQNKPAVYLFNAFSSGMC